eukprot:TRINITY_DN11357_c0_g1_i1.p1 TRINITY_DN11357_c0_g1~~TRINITY_DN11357_c0_g1_i1.p1  ORF type:complete len:335 (+),score=90.00 TRINITY_DN11357_c0_g1_i1:121-1125(+)
MELVTPELVRNVLRDMGYTNVGDEVIGSIMQNSRAQLTLMKQQHRYAGGDAETLATAPERHTDAYYGDSGSGSESDDVTDDYDDDDDDGEDADDGGVGDAAERTVPCRGHHADPARPLMGMSAAGDTSADDSRHCELLYPTAVPGASPRRKAPPLLAAHSPSRGAASGAGRSLSTRVRSVRSAPPVQGSVGLRGSGTAGATGRLRCSPAATTRSAPTPPWDARHCYANLLQPGALRGERTVTGLTPAHFRRSVQSTDSFPPPALGTPPTPRGDASRGVILAAAQPLQPAPGARSRVNDPVARHRQMQQLWKGDPFLRQEGRASLRWQVRCNMLN